MKIAMRIRIIPMTDRKIASPLPTFFALTSDPIFSSVKGVLAEQCGRFYMIIDYISIKSFPAAGMIEDQKGHNVLKPTSSPPFA
jgi:hypothetical protein